MIGSLPYTMVPVSRLCLAGEIRQRWFRSICEYHLLPCEEETEVFDMDAYLASMERM